MHPSYKVLLTCIMSAWHRSTSRTRAEHWAQLICSWALEAAFHKDVSMHNCCLWVSSILNELLFWDISQFFSLILWTSTHISTPFNKSENTIEAHVGLFPSAWVGWREQSAKLFFHQSNPHPGSSRFGEHCSSPSQNNASLPRPVFHSATVIFAVLLESQQVLYKINWKQKVQGWHSHPWPWEANLWSGYLDWPIVSRNQTIGPRKLRFLAAAIGPWDPLQCGWQKRTGRSRWSRHQKSRN